MRTFIATIIVLAAAVASAMVLPKRDPAVWQSPFSGTIESPAANSTIVPAKAFDFKYASSNWCESAFSPFTVYLTDEPCSFGNVTTNGTLAHGTYRHNFGTYMVSNFGTYLDACRLTKTLTNAAFADYSGLPLSDDAKSPPPTLVLPQDFAQDSDSTVQRPSYICVLSEYDGCPVSVSHFIDSMGGILTSCLRVTSPRSTA